MKFKPTIFDPNVGQMKAIVKESKKVTLRGEPLTATPKEYNEIKDTRKALVKARTAITKIGKREREDAIKYQREVIAYERSLIAITAPEEKRLKDLEESIKSARLWEVRKEAMVSRLERLEQIGDDIVIPAEEIVVMSSVEFEAYYNERVGNYNNEMRKELIARKATKEFQEWLDGFGYNDDDYLLVNNTESTTIYKKLATYKHD